MLQIFIKTYLSLQIPYYRFPMWFLDNQLKGKGLEWGKQMGKTFVPFPLYVLGSIMILLTPNVDVFAVILNFLELTHEMAHVCIHDIDFFPHWYSLDSTHMKWTWNDYLIFGEELIFTEIFSWRDRFYKYIYNLY